MRKSLLFGKLEIADYSASCKLFLLRRIIDGWYILEHRLDGEKGVGIKTAKIKEITNCFCYIECPN